MKDFSKYYRAYMYMQELLNQDFTHHYLEGCMADSDKGEDVLTGKTNEKVIDMDWVIAIEEALPYIQKAIDEQRRFIKQVDNVVRVEKAKKITTDSVKHLAQHTNFIAKVEGDKVTPNKILNIEREESFEIYENRVLITLINNTLRFVDDKYSNLKQAPTDSYNNIQMKRHLNMNQQVVDFSINYTNESHEALAEDLDVDVSTLSDFDRIRRIRRTLNDFLATPLMKTLAKTTPVRPPLQQTNLLKKNPNFKKAVELWNFIDSYKKPGFEIVGEEFSGEMPEQIKKDLYLSMSFEHFMMSISTNPGLRRMLDEKYNEENLRLEEEKQRPAEDLRKIIEAQVYAERQEEMDGYLKEIREREKKIRELNAEIKNLKMIIDQREQQILVLRGQVAALTEQNEKLEDELAKTKLKLLEAEKKIKELEAIIEEQKAEIERLNEEIKQHLARIAELEEENAQLKAAVKALTEENEQLKAKVAELENTVKELKAEIASLNEQLARCRERISSLEAEVASQAETIAQQATKIEGLTADNAQLRDSLQKEKEQHEYDVRTQKESYEQQLSEQKNSYENKISEQKSSYESQLSNQKQSYEDKIRSDKAQFDRIIEETNEKCEQKVELAKQNSEMAISQAKKDFEAQSASRQVAFDKEKQSIFAENNKQTENLKKHYESRIAAVNKEKDKAYSVEERKFKAKLAKLEKELNQEYNRKIKEIRAQAAKDVSAARKKARLEVREVKKKARAKMFTKEELQNIE